MHTVCPFCVSYYSSHKQFYDVKGHFNTKKCKIEQSNQNQDENQNEATINNENNEIENAQNEPTINNQNSNSENEKSKNKLNETEIEFLMLGIDNSISLKLLEKFKSFLENNKNKLTKLRFTPQYG
ncbi:hypothetical protein ACTFIY_009678 [Dictyostelium cf. discoideum]